MPLRHLLFYQWCYKFCPPEEDWNINSGLLSWKPIWYAPCREEKRFGAPWKAPSIEKYTHTHFFPSWLLSSIWDDILNGVAEVFFFLSCTLLFLDGNASPWRKQRNGISIIHGNNTDCEHLMQIFKREIEGGLKNFPEKK